MPIEEFEKIHFKAGMKAKYQGQTYAVASIDFSEKLFGLANPDFMEDLIWCRCENIELLEQA